MNNEALSQPVAYTFDEEAKPLYSQEYVTALLVNLKAEKQCKDAATANLTAASTCISELSNRVHSLLAALEEKDQSIKELEDGAALDQYRIKTLEALADQNDKQRDHWMERAKAAEQRLQQPIKLPIKHTGFDGISTNIGDSVRNKAIDDCADAIRSAGFSVEGK